MGNHRKIAVGSTNPVKVTAAQTAFESIWPEHKWQVYGMEVGSGVSDQPMSDTESITGATTRAWRSLQTSDAEYGVGLEGGVHPVLNSRLYWQHLLQLDEKVFGRQDPNCQEEIFFDCGWAVVMDRQGTVGIASSIRMQVPSIMMKHIHQGLELGLVDDLLFDQVNSKQQSGHFGLMSNNVITREQAYIDGVVSALSRFLHPDLFTQR